MTRPEDPRHRFAGTFRAVATGVGAAMRRVRGHAVTRHRYRRQLFEAEVGALVRLREASQLRDDLVASVSHEFRTPLTTIRGNAITLLDRYDGLCPADRERLLTSIVEHSERLGRLLEEMVVAASAAAVDRGAAADLTDALRGFTGDEPGPPVRMDVAQGLAAYIDQVWLHQIVQALRDHVHTESRWEQPVEISAVREDCEVVISVRYAPLHPLDDATTLFDAFAPGDRLRTGRPVSLALYVARRLAEVHGGRVASERVIGEGAASGGRGATVRLSVCLRAADTSTPARPAILPAVDPLPEA